MTQTLLLPPEHEEHLLPERTELHPESVVRETREQTGSLFDQVKSGLRYLRTLLGNIVSPVPKEHQKPKQPKRLSFEEHREESWVPFEGE